MTFIHSEKPIRIERGDGVWLYDDDGRAYLDAGASYACTPLGHCHPAVVEAVQEQVAELTFVQASYPTDVRDRAYRAVEAAAPDGLDHVWLCNSGTEANEAALKFARSATGDSEIVATRRGFHGRTMGSLSTTWTKSYREPFEPLIGDVTFVPFGDEAALREAVGPETAAVIVEPIQGEGGINPAPPGYLGAAREATAEAGAALILDEVQTGVGRTGATWACQRDGVVPDVLTSAKGLGNGLPVGAAMVADWIAEDPGPHNSTFSGGPVVSAAVAETLSILHDDDVPENAAAMGERLRSGLTERLDDAVREVRGEGLLVGVEVKRGANRVVRDLALDHGILALPAGRTVVRLLPPLIIDAGHVDQIVDAFAAVVGADDDGPDQRADASATADGEGGASGGDGA
ncbi:MAG: aspartate aminotransferase family protein [Halobacteriaceae archaeon]